MVSYIKAGIAKLNYSNTFSEIETAPTEIVHQTQQRMLSEQISYLRSHSKFYRNRFAAAGIEWEEIRSIADLARLPFTIKQDLRDSLKAAPPFGEHLAVDVAKIAQM